MSIQFIVEEPSNESSVGALFLAEMVNIIRLEFGGFLYSKMVRDCDFCEFSAEYDDWPDDSVIHRGVAACAGCLERPKVQKVFELTANADLVDLLQEA